MSSDTQKQAELTRLRDEMAILQGQYRDLHEATQAIADKIEFGQKLTAEEEKIRSALEAMKEAACKPKEERQHPLQHLTAVVPKTIVTDLSASDEDNVSEMGV